MFTDKMRQKSHTPYLEWILMVAMSIQDVVDFVDPDRLISFPLKRVITNFNNKRKQYNVQIFIA